MKKSKHDHVYRIEIAGLDRDVTMSAITITFERTETASADRKQDDKIRLAAESEKERSIGVRCLADMRSMFSPSDDPDKPYSFHRDRISSAAAVEALSKMKNSPWAKIGTTGRKLTTIGLSRILRRYNIRPTTVRIDGHPTRGYRAVRFTDAWAKHLPPSTSEPLAAGSTQAPRNLFTDVLQ